MEPNLTPEIEKQRDELLERFSKLSKIEQANAARFIFDVKQVFYAASKMHKLGVFDYPEAIEGTFTMLVNGVIGDDGTYVSEDMLVWQRIAVYAYLMGGRSWAVSRPDPKEN